MRLVLPIFLGATLTAAALACQQSPPEQLAPGVRAVPCTDATGTTRLAVVIALPDGGELVVDPAFPAGLHAARTHLASLQAPLTIALGSDAPTATAAASATVAHPAGLVVDGAARTLAVRRELAFGAGERRVLLRVLGRGRSVHDAVVWVPDAGVLVGGPAVPGASPGAGADTDLLAWRRHLDDLLALEPRIVVPSTGAAAGDADLLTDAAARIDAAITRARSELAGEREADAEPGALLRAARGAVVRGGDGRLGDTRNSAVAVPVADADEPPQLVYLGPPLDDALRGRLRAVAPNVDYRVCDDLDEAREHAATAHGCDARFARAALLREAPALRWVQAWSAGVERHLAVDELRDADEVLLCNMRALSAAPIADHAFGLLLSLTRSLPQFYAAQRRGEWDGRAGRVMTELDGATLLVLGLGGIGTEIARRGAGFGMRVLATDVSTEPVPDHVERIEPPDRLDALLPLADVVAVCLPSTPQTRGLLDAERIARMKDGALLVNVARGAIVDTTALLAALETGQLAGAALDVVDPEPLPADHPLWQRADVVLTPHVAGRSAGTDRRERALFVENMRRFARGLPLLNVVDKRAGY